MCHLLLLFNDAEGSAAYDAFEETAGQTHHVEHPVLNTLQMHITYAGSSSMLFNEEPMRGTPRMVQKLAEREAAVSEAVSLRTHVVPVSNTNVLLMLCARFGAAQHNALSPGALGLCSPIAIEEDVRVV